MSPRRLIVVDGDPAVVDLVTSILRREDCEIAGTHEGHIALEELAAAPYDAAIAGTGEDGLDPLEFLRRSRAISPGTRVVVLDARRDAERVLAAARGGAYSFFHKPLTPGPLVDMVHQALESSFGWPDDLQVLSARPEFISLAIRCKFAAGDRSIHFLRETLCDVSLQQGEDLIVALRELLMNSIEHGGHEDPAQWVQVSLIRTAKSIAAHLQDPGPGFSMTGIPHAAISNPLDSPIRHAAIRAWLGQRPGGFGILMTKNLVDELLYSERGNEVVIVKYL